MYVKIDPLREGDKEAQPEIINIVRECVEARTYKRAVDILRRHSWGDPEGCAAELRGKVECPTCRGDGVI